MIDYVLNLPDLQQRPPVLIDIGASGQVHPRWRAIARHSICIAFDADSRDFSEQSAETSAFRKLYTFNSLVADFADEAAPFYLTRSPHCSSLLRPLPDNVREYAYADKFEIERVVSLRTRSLTDTLRSAGLDYVDWFKTDSQGTDLRLFRNLGDDVAHRVLAAEFEPGILSVYEGEDMLHAVLAHMETSGHFFLAELLPKGSPRITPALLSTFSRQPLLKKLVMFSLKKSTIWGELTYLNRFRNPSLRSRRDWLLGWVFATVLHQHGFALILTERAKTQFPDDSVWEKLAVDSRRRVWGRVLGLKFWPAVVTKLDEVLTRLRR